MDVPAHAVVQGFDVVCILAHQERRQVMLDHRYNGMPAPTAGIGIARPAGAVVQRDGRRDQLEMRVVAMLGVAQNFLQGNAKKPRVNGRDFRHFSSGDV